MACSPLVRLFPARCQLVSHWARAKRVRRAVAGHPVKILGRAVHPKMARQSCLRCRFLTNPGVLGTRPRAPGPGPEIPRPEVLAATVNGGVVPC